MSPSTRRRHGCRWVAAMCGLRLSCAPGYASAVRRLGICRQGPGSCSIAHTLPSGMALAPRPGPGSGGGRGTPSPSAGCQDWHYNYWKFWSSLEPQDRRRRGRSRVSPGRRHRVPVDRKARKQRHGPTVRASCARGRARSKDPSHKVASEPAYVEA